MVRLDFLFTPLTMIFQSVTWTVKEETREQRFRMFYLFGLRVAKIQCKPNQ